MRVRGTSNNTNSRRPPVSRVISFAVSVLIACVGFFISLPFTYVFIIKGLNVHYITWSILLYIVGFIVGAPMFLMGLIGLIANKHNNGSLVENDIARIRYVAENSGVKK